jgi:hypothetical protein
MHHRTRLVLSALAATVALAAAVGTASARRLELSNQRFRVVWQTQPLIFETESGRAICPLTLEGSFHSRTLSKVCGQLIGYITKAGVINCGTAGGARELRLLTETLPWHVRYASFTGTLPRITKIRIQVIGWAFLLNLELIGSCLYRSTAAFPAFFEFEVNEPTGEITHLIADSAAQIKKSGEAPFCPAEARLSASGVVSLQGSGTETEQITRIFVRLVQ